MNHRQPERTRPRGQTGGTAERPARRVSGPPTVFDPSEEAGALRQETTWQQGDRDAKTFVKESGLRVVLTVLKSGATVKEHRVPGPATVQALSGRISLEFSIALPRGADGEPCGPAAMIPDVTARWERDRALRERLAALESRVPRVPESTSRRGS